MFFYSNAMSVIYTLLQFYILHNLSLYGCYISREKYKIPLIPLQYF